MKLSDFFANQRTFHKAGPTTQSVRCPSPPYLLLTDTVRIVPFNTGARPGFDPIIGQNKGKEREMIGYDVDDLSKKLKMPHEFVVSQGGEYFFLPSMKTLRDIGEIVSID
jgi:hypothetical protein